jgi:hypothetical protein
MNVLAQSIETLKPFGEESCNSFGCRLLMMALIKGWIQMACKGWPTSLYFFNTLHISSLSRGKGTKIGQCCGALAE